MDAPTKQEIVVLESLITSPNVEGSDGEWTIKNTGRIIYGHITAFDFSGAILPTVVYDDISAFLKLGNTDSVIENKRIPIFGLNRIMQSKRFAGFAITHNDKLLFKAKHTLAEGATANNTTPISVKITLIIEY